MGLACLRLLHETLDARVVAVCTRKRGDVWWGEHNLPDYCDANGIPVIQRDQIPQTDVDMLISVLYPFIIEGEYLEHPKKGSYNLHEAPLPRWRGCNGYSHAILEGDDDYGTTLHEMVAELDAGRIVAQHRFPIQEDETAKELYERTSHESYRLACEWFPRLLVGDIDSAPPSEKESSFSNARDSLAPLKKLPHDLPVEDVYKRARALDFVPFEPAFFERDGQRYYVFVGDSLDRETFDLSNAAPLQARDLGTIQMKSLTRVVVDGFARPLVICDAHVYRQNFPLFGMQQEVADAL